MLVPFNRTAITAAWFVVLGLVALLWSPPSVAMGVFVLLVGLACSGGDARLVEDIRSGCCPRAALASPRAARRRHRTTGCSRAARPWSVRSTTSCALHSGRAQKECYCDEISPERRDDRSGRAGHCPVELPLVPLIGGLNRQQGRDGGDVLAMRQVRRRVERRTTSRSHRLLARWHERPRIGSSASQSLLLVALVLWRFTAWSHLDEPRLETGQWLDEIDLRRHDLVDVLVRHRALRRVPLTAT